MNRDIRCKYCDEPLEVFIRPSNGKTEGTCPKCGLLYNVRLDEGQHIVKDPKTGRVTLAETT